MLDQIDLLGKLLLTDNAEVWLLLSVIAEVLEELGKRRSDEMAGSFFAYIFYLIMVFTNLM